MYGIVVRADSQWKTIQEFLQYSRENPQKLSYGTSGVGIPPHLAMEELSLASGIKWVHVPYKGTAEVNPALLGGHVDFLSDASGWVPLVDAGKFRVLATWGEQRCARYPQIPTIKEIGYDVFIPGPLGIVGPKGMPKPIAEKLHDSFRKAMDDPEFQSALKKFDMDRVYMSSAEYEKFVQQDSERIEKIIKKLGLQQK
jgi:tripartite-type tricarboxylate transporter receptor subunit TctC